MSNFPKGPKSDLERLEERISQLETDVKELQSAMKMCAKLIEIQGSNLEMLAEELPPLKIPNGKIIT